MQKIILAFLTGAALAWAATGVSDRDRAIQIQTAQTQLQTCQTQQSAFKDGLVYGGRK